MDLAPIGEIPDVGPRKEGHSGHAVAAGDREKKRAVL